MARTLGLLPWLGAAAGSCGCRCGSCGGPGAEPRRCLVPRGGRASGLDIFPMGWHVGFKVTYMPDLPSRGGGWSTLAHWISTVFLLAAGWLLLPACSALWRAMLAAGPAAAVCRVPSTDLARCRRRPWPHLAPPTQLRPAGNTHRLPSPASPPLPSTGSSAGRRRKEARTPIPHLCAGPLHYRDGRSPGWGALAS
eukprot:COSAG01_NODE_5890_length_3967_cov_83.799121_6_plen_195_part_00